ATSAWRFPMRFATTAIHAGQAPDPQTGAVTPPIYMTSTYSQKAQAEYVYGRGANPTRDALQKSLAALEAGKRALSFSSGMGAITTALTLLKKGDHAIVTDDCYGGVYRIFTRIMSGYGIESTFLDLRDLVDVEDAFRPETKMVWMESPTNPLMKVVDLKELAVISKAHDAISVCDNTFGSPALQNPLGLGVDLVVHSTTKYIGGHADLLGGVESLIEHPASMTHSSVPKEQREKQGITEGLVRFSVGLEDAADLQEDLQRALG